MPDLRCTRAIAAALGCIPADHRIAPSTGYPELRVVDQWGREWVWLVDPMLLVEIGRMA